VVLLVLALGDSLRHSRRQQALPSAH